MAGRTGAGFFAGVLNLDAVREQRVENRHALGGIDFGAGRAKLGVRQYLQLRHQLSKLAIF
jgi:hypothetical protein